MIAVKSIFDLQEFIIIKNSYEFKPPHNKNILIDAITKEYELDIDYSIQANNKNNLMFQVFVKIELNKEHVLPGYNIFIEGVGFFNFSKNDNLSNDDKLSFLQGSGISICINCLRGIIAGLTAFGPFGKYLLPSIDVNSLINQKRETIKNRNASKIKHTTKANKL